MATGWTITEANPSDLKNHPVNIEIYGTQSPCDEMLASIKEHGVIEPIRCTKDMVVLSGHRRRQHAIIAKLKTVPVLVARNAIGEPEQIVEIIESNRQREKTREVRAREFGRLAEAKAELARQRQLSGLRKGKEVPVPKIISEREKGEAKAQAAEEVGMSRPTAEKAAAVVEVIDELVEAGETEKAAEIRETLNTKSVAAAARAAGVEPKKDGAKPEEKPVVDSFDVAVPKSLISVFKEVSTFKGIQQRIGKLQNEIEELQRSDAGAALPIQAILNAFKEIKQGVKFAIPYCECPKCRRGKKECTACEGLRWITEATFKRCRTEEDEQWLKTR